MKIIVGQFGQSYGVKGWLKVHSLTDPVDNILRYSPWQVQHAGQWTVINITAAKQQSKNIIVKLPGCDTPELAQTYANNPIAIERAQLPVLPQGEYYWTDLIGLTVINQDGIQFGQVESLFETGSNDVLVIKGDRRRLLPYISTVIKHIDLTHKIIHVIWEADF